MNHSYAAAFDRVNGTLEREADEWEPESESELSELESESELDSDS